MSRGTAVVSSQASFAQGVRFELHPAHVDMANAFLKRTMQGPTLSPGIYHDVAFYFSNN